MAVKQFNCLPHRKLPDQRPCHYASEVRRKPDLVSQAISGHPAGDDQWKVTLTPRFTIRSRQSL